MPSSSGPSREACRALRREETESGGEGVSMHPSVLASIDATVAKHFPTLLSLLIERDGMLVCERSYQHGDLAAPANVKSVTKSIVSALVGIALREGDLLSLDQRVEEFFPQFFPAGGDQRTRSLWLPPLLPMPPGLRCTAQSAEP